MNQYENPPKLDEWKKIARMDWERIKRNLRDKDAVVAGFFLQQCIEKFIKAFLILHGCKLRKIHKLDTLLDEAIKYCPELKSFYDLCERVSTYYIADRYPPFGTFEYTCEDIQNDLKEAETFIKILFPDEELENRR